MQRIALLFCLAPLVAISGCGSREPAGPRPGGTLHLAVRDAPPLSPLRDEDPLATPFLNLLYEGLVRFDSTASAVLPAHAESWEVSPDSLNYTFHLHAGRLYENGQPIAAADYVRALRAVFARQPLSAGRTRFWALGGALSRRWRGNTFDVSQLGVEAPDSLTVRIHLEFPEAGFLEHLADVRYAVPIPEGAASESGEIVPPASGPYRVERGDQRLFFLRNSQYAGAQPSWLDTIVVRIGIGPRNLITQAARGIVDVVWPEPPGHRGRLQREAGLRLVTGNAEWRHFLVLNGSVPPTSSVDVRWAIASGIERAELPAPWEPWSDLEGEGAVRVPLPTFDPAGVEVALQSVRRRRGLELPVTVLRDGEAESLLSALLAGWALAGLHAEAKSLRGEDFARALERRAGFQGAIWSMRAPRDRTTPWLELLLDRALDPRWGDNLPHFFEGGEELDTLLVAAALARPGAARQSAERVLLARLASLLPLLPVARRPETAWVRADVRNLLLHPAYGPLWGGVWLHQSTR